MKRCAQAPCALRRQRGAALLLAMIIVTLIATLAVSMVWQQWRAIQVESAERARAQSAWILSGALDWAGLILKEDARPARKVDHLGEPWAVPLAEARLSTFIAADKDNADDGPEAFLSGSIIDAQARMNLRNLIEPDGKVSVQHLAALHRLCEVLDVASGVADQIATGMQEALAPRNSPTASRNAPFMPRYVSQLSWLGADPQSLQRLAPHIVILPQATTVNINTASREVIAAVIPGINIGDAERLVQYRERTPFENADDIRTLLPRVDPQLLGGVNVMSRYFEVRGRLRLADRVLEQRSLVERDTQLFRVLSSERVSSTDGGP